nr:hypothetical protein [Tanacetum cinerariifolium]
MTTRDQQSALDNALVAPKNQRVIGKYTQVYGAILPKSMMNQAMQDSVAYKTYYAIASGAKPPKSKKPQMKSDSAILSEETPSKKKPTKAKKDVPSKKKPTSKPKPTKKNALVKDDRGKDKTTSIDEGTDAKLEVPDVPKYLSDSENKSWGDSGDDESNDDDSDEVTKDDDVKSDTNEDKAASDNEKTDSNEDEKLIVNHNDDEEEEHEEEYSFEFNDDEEETMTTRDQQSALDNTLVAPKNQRVIGKCNMKINLGMKPNEPTYQVVLDALALITCYPASLLKF